MLGILSQLNIIQEFYNFTNELSVANDGVINKHIN